jgi:hypothetical protein
MILRMRVGFPSINLKWIISISVLLSDIDLLVELSFCNDFENFVYILLKLAYHVLMSLFLLEFS